MNVRTAASVTDRLDGAAAAPAGLESAVREVSLYSHLPTETVTSWDLLHGGNYWTGNIVYFH